MRLWQQLEKLKTDGYYPYHMPGHKRNGEFEFEFVKDAYDVDITEIEGFDNLHDAEGIIKEAEINAANVYGSLETHFLVNGSTCGILSAIASVSETGKKIIVARNCHVSVYNAIKLNMLEPVFIYPEVIETGIENTQIQGSMRPETVEKAVMDNPDAVAVVITSPTYDGVLSDIANIVKVAHEYDIPVIVDEAHGALFFMEGRSAVSLGADIVINSVHKTLPALTQTALIHINGQIVNKEAVRKYLKIYQTSSPSYVLMGSIDYAMDIVSSKGNSLYIEFCKRTVKLKEAFSKLRNLKYVSKDYLINNGAFDFDESKVLVGSDILSGKKLSNILYKEYKIVCEMAAGGYVLLMTTLFDTDEGVERLIKALNEIDLKLSLQMLDSNEESEKTEISDSSVLDDRISYINDQKGKVSASMIFAYPPGIPIVAEGEVITEDAISKISECIKKGLDIKGI